MARLRLRAQLLQRVRTFFTTRAALEVETPLLISAAVSDVNLASAAVALDASTRTMFLQTSPEYAMKRLLAAGSGDIWQLCKVVRGNESGPLHNPEFSLLEWYRVATGMAQIAAETCELLAELLGAGAAKVTSERYVALFNRYLALDPLSADRATLEQAVGPARLDATALASLSRDQLLDAIMGLVIGPQLGFEGLQIVSHYPASQAALAQLDPADPALAARFEIYYRGVELANGFCELGDATEQRTRFETDNLERQRRGLPVVALDESLLAALAHGLPACSGVAVGFDRIVMLASAAARLGDVISFTTERA